MDLTHWVLLGVLLVTGVIYAVLLWGIARALKRDEAIDAATFLALRELRERFERSK